MQPVTVTVPLPYPEERVLPKQYRTTTKCPRHANALVLSCCAQWHSLPHHQQHVLWKTWSGVIQQLSIPLRQRALDMFVTVSAAQPLNQTAKPCRDTCMHSAPVAGFQRATRQPSQHCCHLHLQRCDSSSRLCGAECCSGVLPWSARRTLAVDGGVAAGAAAAAVVVATARARAVAGAPVAVPVAVPAAVPVPVPVTRRKTLVRHRQLCCTQVP